MFHKRISALILLILPLFIYAPARAETAALNADMQEHARSNAKISIQTSQPYGLFYKTDAKSITLFFDNIKGDVGSISIDMTCKNAWGNAQSFFPKSITLNAANHYRNRIDPGRRSLRRILSRLRPVVRGQSAEPGDRIFRRNTEQLCQEARAEFSLRSEHPFRTTLGSRSGADSPQSRYSMDTRRRARVRRRESGRRAESLLLHDHRLVPPSARRVLEGRRFRSKG